MKLEIDTNPQWRYNTLISSYWSEDVIGMHEQGLSQDLETGCLKLAIVNFMGVQMFKDDHNIVRF